MIAYGKKLEGLAAYEPDHGEYKVALNANESFITIDGPLKEAMMAAVEQVQWNRYPDPYATKLCQGFADFFKVDANLVTAGNGSDEIIGLLMNCLLQPGDKVLTTQWDFSMYEFYAYMNGCETITLEKKDDLSIDVQQLIETTNDQQVQLLMF